MLDLDMIEKKIPARNFLQNYQFYLLVEKSKKCNVLVRRSYKPLLVKAWPSAGAFSQL